MTDWLEDERRRTSFRRELRRCFRRAAARWWLTLLVTGAIAGLVVVRAARKQPAHKARVVLRITEGSIADGELLPPSELRDYLSDVAFNKARLLGVMRKLDLYADEREVSEALAVETMREDLGISVSNNYFLEYRDENAPPRSVRVQLSYQTRDPELATRVAEELARVLIESETENRRQLARLAADAVRAATAQVREAIQLQQQELGMKGLALRRGEGDREILRLEIAKLGGNIEAMQSQLRSLEADERNLSLREKVEDQQLGLQFHVAAVVPPDIVEKSAKRMAFLFVVLFVMCLPLCALAVGAFDARIRDGDDVRRLGLDLVGHVPDFPGDDVGSLRGRSARRVRN